jgi:hypothetical protein
MILEVKFVSEWNTHDFKRKDSKEFAERRMKSERVMCNCEINNSGATE